MCRCGTGRFRREAILVRSRPEVGDVKHSPDGSRTVTFAAVPVAPSNVLTPGSTSTSRPPTGSWLNLVERWFAELTTKKIKRGAHTSVPALERDIRGWIV